MVYILCFICAGSIVRAVRATDGDAVMNSELQDSFYGQHLDLFSIHPGGATVFSNTALKRKEDVVLN